MATVPRAVASGHQADAVVEGRHVRAGTDVEVVGGRADGVGDGEDGGEVVGETAGNSGGAFERVGLAGAGHPRHANVAAFLGDGGDAEERGAVGRVGAGKNL